LSKTEGTAVKEQQMTIEEARAFVESVPWRWVKGTPEGPENKPPDPHQYVILGWPGVEADELWRFVALIRETGYRGTYRAPYRPEFVMRNHYLELDGWCYWWIDPKMLNRERAEERKHVPETE
jgi:hypothetical protein